MFLQLPDPSKTTLQDQTLIVNTILLIVFILIAEFGFAEMPAGKRLRLRYVYPFIMVLIGLLIFAAYHQGGAK